MVPTLQFEHWQWLSLALAGPVIVWGAAPFHTAAWANLREGRASTDTLISLGALAASAWSLYTLFIGHAGDPGMRHGFSLAPQPGMADSQMYLEAAVAVVVFALAGRYIETRAVQHPEATRPTGEVARRRSTDGRPPIERVAAAFVPAIIVLAAATFGFWVSAAGDAATAFTAAFAVLIIASPCAIGLAAPSAFSVGARRGANLGVAFSGPDAVERTHRVDTIMFDAADILTTGTATLVDIATTPETTTGDALRLAGSLATASAHPIAATIASAARSQRLDLYEVDVLVTHPGLGLRGVIESRTIVVGHQRFAAAWLPLLPIAAAGLLTPMIAGAAKTVSTTFVVANSLRLRRFKPRRPPAHRSRRPHAHPAPALQPDQPATPDWRAGTGQLTPNPAASYYSTHQM